MPTVTLRDSNRFQAAPTPVYTYCPAWWIVETGCPMDSMACDDCCSNLIDAAWKRHDDKVRATRMTDQDIIETAKFDSAVCDFCGKVAR